MQELIEKALRKASLDIGALLQENSKVIRADLETVMMQDSDKPPKFPITVGIKLCPAGKLIRVKTKIGWGRKSVDEAESDVDAMTPELPGMAQEAKPWRDWNRQRNCRRGQKSNCKYGRQYTPCHRET